MSEIAPEATAHEAYAFACMKCGYGWEQAYEIEHHVDVSGRAFVVYRADGERVPSPLSTPTCVNCGGHVVRIMRAGRVSTAQNLLRQQDTRTVRPAGSTEEVPVAPAGAPAAHQGRLAGLLHAFHRR